jgi:beta-lactamase regulating signal transducer with metallopeptidase domain
LELNCPLFSIKKCWGKGFVLTNVVWAMSLLLIKIGRIMNKKYFICLPKTNIMKLVVISLLSFFIVFKANGNSQITSKIYIDEN